MIKIRGKRLFAQVVKDARTNGSFEALKSRLQYLHTYGSTVTKCNIFVTPGAVNLGCLDITMYSKNDDNEWDFWFNGGLVYHKFNNSWGVHT